MKLKTDLIGLDLGKSTTGLARIHVQARIAEPLDPFTMNADANLLDHVKAVVEMHEASAVVVGVPRSLQGNDTEQTDWSENVISGLRTGLHVPVYTIDEAGTTKLAEQRAQDNQSVDSVAAGIILEDFLSEVERGNVEDVSL